MREQTDRRVVAPLPSLPAGASRRARLIAALDTGVQRAVTLICAGPGWGKTASAATWAAERAAGWLTLDARHNDPDHFQADLDLALHDEPGVLILDDLQAITDQRVLGILAGLVHRRSERLRFVLISRRRPDLALHRLRISGDLTEIGSADLGFQLDEAAELLQTRGRTMSRHDLAEVVRRTEGWPAGLRLILDTPDPAAADEIVEEYLIREVLPGLDDRAREFLMRTSIPNRICGHLADALTGDHDGHRMLEHLVQRNLFVERCGDDRWFRYHPLFRSALRRRLARRRPAEPARLHRATAAWHVKNGSVLTAITHAAESGDWDMTARYAVRRGLPLFTSADRPQFVEALRRIPLERLSDSAELAVCGAVLVYAHGDHAAMPRAVATAEALLAGRDEAARTEVGAALAVLRATSVVRWRGDMNHLVETSTATLNDLARRTFDELPALTQYRAMMLNCKGAGLLWTGRLDHADRYLWAATSSARTADVPLFEINSLALLAQLAFVQGALRESERHADAADQVARRLDVQYRMAMGPAYLARALVESERGRDAEAEEQLRGALHAIGERPEVAQSVLAGLVRVRLLTDRGETAAAGAVLSRIAAEIGPPVSAPLLNRLLALADAEIRLMLGDSGVVLARYRARAGLLPAEQLCLARAYQATGNQAAAETLLGRVRAGSDRVSAVGAWILTALAADAQGRSSVASEALARALAIAEPERIRRPFRTYDAQRVLVLAERRQWLTELRGPAGGGGTVLAEITGEIPVLPGVPAAGPLSEREVDVLQYLPTVLTAAEIAANLGISVNTVKAHMRSIYRKYGVGRRREAVIAARQAGLI
ncbi:LuxR C-terminal-related transcriptional regulator [Actinoplanes sichuanensis]|uniref:LuxR C-terminal-related transcriptional regulator n=1 Tax=Actinoplanes sichuanensis TaxID=512349 RepID=A0ABW4A848_9ACTN|nr:LuxR C-terminal-related transcriptional regulator [Actinoplanes sichuanensis]BEL03355.1 LuxR C-terminal-related transcriptional regulator [Actinoplanes sichuanensis]